MRKANYTTKYHIKKNRQIPPANNINYYKQEQLVVPQVLTWFKKTKQALYKIFYFWK